MRIRKLAAAGVALAVLALLFAFTPAKAEPLKIEGSIQLGQPGGWVGVGHEYMSHPCEELKNEDGSGNYDGFDGVWIDLRDKAQEGTPLAVTMDQTLDIDIYFYALQDLNEDGEPECTRISDSAVAGGFFGEGETGEVYPGAQFIWVEGWGGHGDFTVTLG